MQREPSLPVRTGRVLPTTYSQRTWSDWWNRMWTRLVSDGRFQRWSAAFPLTRPFARQSAQQLFDLCAGFVYSQVLFACVRSKLFEHLSEGPLTTNELARLVDLSPEATARLVDAAAALKLTVRLSEDRVGLGELGAALLGNPGVARMIEHHAMLYKDLTDPLALLRGGAGSTELEQFWAYARSSQPSLLKEEQVAEYSELMAASQAMIANEVLSAYPIHRHRRLLDAGGGQGAFIAAVAKKAPDLELMLFDLPPVAARARRCLNDSGFGDRVDVVGGDLFNDDLPTGCDIISLVRIVHDHNDSEALAILRAVRKALPPGGTILLAEPMAGTRGAEAMGDAYFGFYLLAMGSGRPRTASELRYLLHQAGFVQPRMISTNQPLLTRLMTATASRS
ncbi:MAG: methyltransferase [Myxococcota bacterium]